MSYPRTLPFPRGTTMSQGSGQTLSDTIWKKLEGSKYSVTDTEHGTGQEVVLRVVKNDTTDLTVARACVSFSKTSEDDWGCRVDGLAGTEGEVAKPIDDAYYGHLTKILADDLFYVVEEGPCDIAGVASGCAITEGCGVAAHASGLIDIAADAQYIVGTACEAQSTSVSPVVLTNVMAGIATIKGGKAGTAD